MANKRMTKKVPVQKKVTTQKGLNIDAHSSLKKNVEKALKTQKAIAVRVTKEEKRLKEAVRRLKKSTAEAKKMKTTASKNRQKKANESVRKVKASVREIKKKGLDAARSVKGAENLLLAAVEKEFAMEKAVENFRRKWEREYDQKVKNKTKRKKKTTSAKKVKSSVGVSSKNVDEAVVDTIVKKPLPAPPNPFLS